MNVIAEAFTFLFKQLRLALHHVMKWPKLLQIGLIRPVIRMM